MLLHTNIMHPLMLPELPLLATARLLSAQNQNKNWAKIIQTVQRRAEFCNLHKL